MPRRGRIATAALLAAAVACAAPSAAAAASDVMYVTTLSSGLFAYGVNASSGDLRPVGHSPFPIGDDGFGVTATPDQRHLYVSNYGDNTLSGFNVCAGGVLGRTPGPLKFAHQPVLSATTPNGRFLYVANDGEPGGVAGFAIKPGSGKLRQVPGSPVRASDTGPFGVAVSPDGRFLYISNTGNSPFQPGSVSVYRIARETGTISEIASSPYKVGLDSGGVAITPDGDHLYVANDESSTISAFNRDPDSGKLTPVRGSPFPAGNGGPTGLAITADGKHLYSANQSMVSQADNQVLGFAIKPGNGALAPAPGSPYEAGLGPQFAAITGDGAHVYVTNNGSQDLSGYAIQPGSGALSRLAGSPFRTGRNPLGITIIRAPRGTSNRFSFGRVKRSTRQGRARMRLCIPGPGTVRIGGRQVKRRGRHVTAPRPSFRVAATEKAKRHLRRRGQLRLRVNVSYTPDGGTARTQTRRVPLIMR